MSISNKFGAMVVTTGNKSEMSVGYATLYGDMNGGFNPIKDLYKMEVFALAALRNRWKPHDARVPTGKSFRTPFSPRRRARNCARISATKTRCRPIRFSTPSSTGWSRKRCASPT